MYNTKSSDLMLIEGYISGNEICIELLINRHKKKIFNYILMTVRNTHLAEDIFQDTFIKVIYTIKSGDYKEEGKFLSWVNRIAHNLVIDHFRKQKRIPTIENEGDSNIFDNIRIHENSIEHSMIYEQIHSDLRSLIELLPAEQKDVLIMRHYYDMSFKEIAEQTEVSINTALGRMRYAIINLRKLIEEKNMIMTY
jgi:RNA polymerase sigma-70 factor (ECF subfamily)